MNNKYAEYIALLDLTTYHYKVLLLLHTKPYNQAQLAELLNIQKQNAHKYIKELESKNLIDVEREEGRNKFYKPVMNLEKIQSFIPGQQRLFIPKK